MSWRWSRRLARSGHETLVRSLLTSVVGLLLLAGMTQAGAATVQVHGYVPQVIPCGPVDLVGQTQYACPGSGFTGASMTVSLAVIAAPSGVSADSSEAEITVSWVAPVGVAVVSYTIQVRDGLGGTVALHSTAAEPYPASTTFTVTGLAPGDYYVAVSAMAAEGEGDPSDWIGPVTLSAAQPSPESSPTPSHDASPEPSPTETDPVEPSESATSDPIAVETAAATPDASASAEPAASG